jgi:DNA-binding CsgD family transcriptional regulator
MRDAGSSRRHGRGAPTASSSAGQASEIFSSQSLLTIAAYGPDRLRDPAALAEDLAAAVGPRSHWVDVRVLDATGATIAAHPKEASPELLAGLGERLVATARRTGSSAETDWTGAEGRFQLAIAVPSGDGAVVARVDGAALGEQFRRLTLPDRALVTLLDPTNRVVFRSERGAEPSDIVRDQDLTNAEWRVAEAVARGLANKEIAAELGLSLRTVEGHISRILDKKHLSNRVELALHIRDRQEGE